MENLEEQYNHFNYLYKRLDDKYSTLASIYGISDCAMWILYAMRENDNKQLTQTEVAKGLYMSRQSVSSAIKKLEKDGLITLEKQKGNEKNKILHLTEQGKTLAQKTVDKIIKSERSAFQSLKEKERESFIKLTKKYVDSLLTNLDKN